EEPAENRGRTRPAWSELPGIRNTTQASMTSADLPFRGFSSVGRGDILPTHRQSAFVLTSISIRGPNVTGSSTLCASRSFASALVVGRAVRPSWYCLGCSATEGREEQYASRRL